jgi:hypothetical protein
MDRKGPQQVWPLLHQSRAEDGRLRRIHQRASGPCYDLPPPEGIQRQDELEVEDPPDHRVQPCRKKTAIRSQSAHKLTQPTQISPIQNMVYLFSMAIIAGARTFHQIRATVRAGFMPVMKVSWVTSPIALAFAQAFLPQETWVPFFNIIGFIIGTYINSHTKKKRLQALRRKYNDGGRDGRDGRDGRTSDGRSDYGRPGY